MEATTHIKKAIAYLEHSDFLLKQRLMEVRNSTTLLKSALKEIDRLQARNRALEELIKQG